MSNCLGLYIEDNLIKYAKVSKNNEAIKVESFGVKFYENIGSTIKQIVEETYSFKTPIAINTTDEIYNKIEVFSLLSKKDMDSAIKTEFENICYEREINQNIYEQRYVLANSSNSDDKVKAIHISVPKTSIEQKKNQFGEYKVNSIVPLSVAISKLPKKEKKANIIVVNIEKNTTITKIASGSIVSDISILDIGSREILENINKKENSYSKAYEICKATNIYTEADRDLQYEQSEYLEDIMPTLFKIVSEVRKITEESVENIEKVYITGTAALINNIDIYFQDYLRNTQCEILKPNFISNNSKINIKDYIEVNSAIAIALLGLDKNNRNINFTKESGVDKLKTVLFSDVSKKNVNVANDTVNIFLNKYGRQYEVISFTFCMLAIMYFVGSGIINKQLENRIEVANNSIAVTNDRIKQVEGYNQKFNLQIEDYEILINNIESLNDASAENKRYKNIIPNLLNNIMAVIPKEVQLTSIENTSNTHVVINAKSSRYEQIAYFKTKLKVEGILNNVVSNTGTMQNGYLSVTIEGELP